MAAIVPFWMSYRRLHGSGPLHPHRPAL